MKQREGRSQTPRTNIEETGPAYGCASAPVATFIKLLPFRTLSPVNTSTCGIFAGPLPPNLTRFTSAKESSGSAQKVPASIASGEPLSDNDRVGFALVGLGRLAREELFAAFRVSKKAKLTALVSGDRTKAEKLAQENGVNSSSIYSYETFDRIRDNKDVQVVYIALPNSMHGEFTTRSARAGKHVLCEKPMEVSITRCRDMIEDCKRAGVKLMVAYRVQYEPMNRAMKRLIREKVHGPIKFIESVNAQRVQKTEWRLSKALGGSGALGDMGVYCINTIRFLLGEEPMEVFARAFRPSGDPRFREIDATAIWQMRFPSGVLANCMCSFDAHSTQSYRVLAERGTFGMEPAFPYRGLKMFLKPQKPPLPETEESNQFANQLDHMADCVLNNRQPYTPGEEGLQDQRIIEAILESARTTRAVTLPRFDKLDVFRGAVPE